jgi:metallo-beta-lactamase family protein
VTGSRYLVEAGACRVLVDCGLFQGYKALRLRNRAPFPVEPGSIDAVILTHAHLVHSGYLPRLVESGYRGPVWCTPATCDLCGILLPDSAQLLEEEAGYANLKGSSRHHPAEALYTAEQAHRCLRQLRPVAYRETFEPVPGLPESDWLVVESTYGNRRHAGAALDEQIEQALSPVLARGGVVIILAFAVGRAQLLLHAVISLQAKGRLPAVPVYLNSPMACDVTALYERYKAEHRLTHQDLDLIRKVTRVVNSVDESKALNRRHGPMIIISASGMLTGGRVLRHLIAFAPDHRNAIVLSGHQAGGTRGAALVGGATHVRIYGEDIRVKAQDIAISSASAHADADELLDWIRGLGRSPRAVFITHGEPDAADALRLRIEHELGWCACVAGQMQSVDMMLPVADGDPAAQMHDAGRSPPHESTIGQDQ